MRLSQNIVTFLPSLTVVLGPQAHLFLQLSTNFKYLGIVVFSKCYLNVQCVEFRSTVERWRTPWKRTCSVEVSKAHSKATKKSTVLSFRSLFANENINPVLPKDLCKCATLNI